MKKSLHALLVLLISIVGFSQKYERNLSTERWHFKKNKSEEKWFPATVPGTVHTDLFANQLIPDPFFGANEKQLQWIEKEDWEYQTVFSVSKEEVKNQHIVLQFEGLDTYADVFLNDSKVLEVNNMFRTWKIPVKEQLRTGTNTLRIIFYSSVKKGKEEAQKLPYILPGDEKVFTRKAQYQYGWDWGPRFVTAGIWKPVQLIFWNEATIQSIRFRQNELTEKKAELAFDLTIDVQKAGNYTIKYGTMPFERKLKKGINVVSIPVTIKNPMLWWPNGMGMPHQYINEFSLFRSKSKLDEKRLTVGLRTIELIQENDSIGKSFYFKVNGVPVFMKGANYIPPDSFLPRATNDVYKAIVKNAVDSNMNMLRVWGGGVYAADAFYEECDKNGILVWQDFMFACAMYPGDTAFLENVKNEIIDNVTRLQNHPSLALWCGNNENDEGWKNWGWQKQYNYSLEQEMNIWNDYKKVFHELIPQTLDSLLPKNENRYWPSSPSIGWGRKESLLEGDSHYWGVWWGIEPFEMYEKKVGRFMSEYGFQGMTERETFASFANKSDLNFESEAVKNHQKHPTGYKTINEYMGRDYTIPTSFEDYMYVSQLLQADGMKTAIEAHRRAKPNCMGSLYWQLNDCWPVTSWSSLDYFGRWKASHYQVKKSFENLLISIHEEEGKIKAYIINDDLKGQQGTLTMELLDFSGNTLFQHEESINVTSNSAAVYYEIPKTQFKSIDLKNVVLTATFQSEGKATSALYYFLKPKELALIKPTLTWNKIDDSTIEITADVLAKNVMLYQDGTFFSDNYFDVLPNQKVRITLSKPVNNLLVKSLFDTLP